MFSGCNNLAFLNITHFVFNPAKVENYRKMFDNDTEIHLIIPKDFYYSIIDMNDYLNVIEENVTIPELVQEFSVTIEVFKYRKGKGEKEHEKPNLNESVYFLSEDFNCNENDFQVFLDGKEKKFSKNFTFDKEGNYTVTYKLKKNFESLENLFRNCYYITKVNLKKIIGDNLIDVSKMFYNCDGLTQVQLDGLDTKNVKNAEQMFYGCSSLSNLDLSKLDFSKTEEMNSIFNGMESLVSINLNNFNTQNVINMSYMFNGCWNLKNIDFTKIKTNKVQNMNSMFADCFSLENADISTFDLSSVQSTESLFNGCYNLKSIQLPTMENND
jgi:surface protein